MQYVNTKYVIFLHQDIELIYINTISRFLDFLSNLEECDILGVAGRKEGSKYVITNIRHGKNLTYAGNRRVEGLELCQTVDECFFGGYSSFFKSNKFDEIICNNWHLLAGEICLRTLTMGGKVYVCDIVMLHYSSGRVNHFYNKEFYQLIQKYKTDFSFISTSCRNSCTSFPLRDFNYWWYTVRIILNDIKRLIGGKILIYLRH